jgi:hypothetical protein
LSVTSAVKLAVPVAVGVPVIAPVAVTRDNPAGRLPDGIDQTSGVVPPEEPSVWLYAKLTVSAGRVMVVMTGAALIVIDSAPVAEAPTLSVTSAVNIDAPVAVGMPVIAPLDAMRESPAGRLPDGIDQARGAVPPEEASVWLYATLIVSAGRPGVVTAKAAFTTIDSA